MSIQATSRMPEMGPESRGTTNLDIATAGDGPEPAGDGPDELPSNAGRKRGRPSITGSSEDSPRLSVRVRPEVITSLERIAALRGRHLAHVAREALDEYIMRHGH